MCKYKYLIMFSKSYEYHPGLITTPIGKYYSELPSCPIYRNSSPIL